MGDPSHEKSLAELLSGVKLHRKKALNIPLDDLAKEEKGTFEKKKQQSQLDQLTLQNKALQGIIKLREDYSANIFKFLICWSIGVGVVITLQGFKIGGFSIPESVLDFLVGSTTANVIALVGLVVKGLFPKDSGVN